MSPAGAWGGGVTQREMVSGMWGKHFPAGASSHKAGLSPASQEGQCSPCSHHDTPPELFFSLWKLDSSQHMVQCVTKDVSQSKALGRSELPQEAPREGAPCPRQCSSRG